MNMIEFDGLEHVVDESSMSRICEGCKSEMKFQVVDLLRTMTRTDKYVDDADRLHITSYLGQIMCTECRRNNPVYFGYGETQPARYHIAVFS